MLRGRVLPFTEPRNIHYFKGEPQQTVVLVGHDPELLQLRARVISSAGYTVHSLTPDEVTAELLNSGGGQVWVFCHTLEFYQVAPLAVAVRSACSSDKLLRMAGLYDVGHAPNLFDEHLQPVNSVDELLQAVGRLAQQTASGYFG